MANYITNDTDLASVANAIRTKGGTNNLLSFPTGFVSAINDIQTGSGSESSSGELVEKDVNFIDYDGTLLYSYTAEEANTLTGLPPNPSHTGLVAQGWNWTLAEIKSRLASSTGAFFVGQMYTTASGNTEIDIEIDESMINIELAIKFIYYNPNLNGIKVYWGDGQEDVTDSTGYVNLDSSTRWRHIYTNTGNYTISIETKNDSAIRFSARGVLSSYKYTGLFWNQNEEWTSDSHTAPKYSQIVKAVRVGNNCDLQFGAFYYCTSLEYITLPSTITRKHTNIYANTFSNCFSLKSLTIPRGITTIYTIAFESCFSMRNISLPNTISDQKDFTIYSKCYSLENAFVITGATTIGYQFLMTKPALKYLSIPNSITKIESWVFAYCHNLSSIIIPNSVTSIGDYAFRECYLLRNITMSNSITSIGAYAFYMCYTLQSIVLPNTVTSINANTFQYCYSLKNIVLSNSLTSIGTYAFQYCYALESIVFPNTLTTIGGYAFNSCESLKDIEIPNSVTELGGYTFYSCKSLRNIKLPNELTSIGACCFYYCYNLEKVTIPSTVTSIGSMAFAYLTRCKEYHLLPTTPPTLGSSTVFQSIRSDAVIYVPQGCLEAYQTANNWSAHASKMQEEPST